MTNLDLNRHYRNWISAAPNDFNLAICLHTSKHLMAIERGYDDDWLSKKLRRYLNELDRKLFRNQYRKHGKRLQRFVTLGHTDTVGWHAHLIVRTPPGISADKLLLMMKLLWLKHMEAKSACNKSFHKRLFWGEQITGGYSNYTVNNSRENKSSANYSTAHNTWTHDKGVFDLPNCHF